MVQEEKGEEEEDDVKKKMTKQGKMCKGSVEAQEE